MVLAGDGSTVLSSGNLTFSAVYSDSELTDKYATGIDQGGIRVLLDGNGLHRPAGDQRRLTLSQGREPAQRLPHSLTIRLKDFYGNVTGETRSFRVENEEGMRSAIDVLPQPGTRKLARSTPFPS